jgi:hypothetical protein
MQLVLRYECGRCETVCAAGFAVGVGFTAGAAGFTGCTEEVECGVVAGPVISNSITP